MSDPTKKQDVNEDARIESLDAPEISEAELEQVSGGVAPTLITCTLTVSCHKAN
jgi:hypothetical protein